MTAQPERRPTADTSDREAVIELLARILARHWLATRRGSVLNATPEQTTQSPEEPTDTTS
jgi:hypothetical protein